jgi:hypothetical protein
MLTVPGCLPCNREYGKLEERMFVPLVTMLPTDDRTASLVERALRAVDPAAGRNPKDAAFRRRLGESILRRTTVLPPGQKPSMEPAWTRTEPQAGQVGETETGEPVIGTAMLNFGFKNLEPIAIKLLRGCYYHVNGRPLPRTPEPWGRLYTPALQTMKAEFTGRPGAVTRGSFPFSFSLRSDMEQGLAGGFFALWDELLLFASNYPTRHSD